MYTVHTHTDMHIYLCVLNLQGHRNFGCSFLWTEQKRISQCSSFQFLNSLFIQRITWTFWTLLQAIPVLIREQNITLSQYSHFSSSHSTFLLPFCYSFAPSKKLDSSWKIMWFLSGEYMVKCCLSLYCFDVPKGMRSLLLKEYVTFCINWQPSLAAE